ncbi:MAG TPA: CDP-alcohol phosphatidyltransferase family protein [Sphingomicrobium sp.]|jgi:phosphatidylglycerophosphate synthase|nr:CDP-alcohol phosphatidyltransferase family protein [Sphingomicrobium sp.]
MNAAAHPAFVPVGDNPTRLFGMDAETRACRLAANAGFDAGPAEPARGVLLANMDFAWDPAWLEVIGTRPGAVLMSKGAAVLAYVPEGAPPGPVEKAMLGDGGSLDGLDPVDAEYAKISYSRLRKRERPFVLPLAPDTADQVERAAYDASYKGVTDALTLYLWRKPAFYLTRWAAEAEISPNAVTAVGAVLCLLAFFYFWFGNYWLGVVAGFIFMVLDTVDGKLARCTGASSKWGNIFDHGIDLVHPPFWYWAWAHGLAAYGRPLEPVYETMLVATIVIAYIAQRAIEGIFMARFAMHIHVWRKVDSQFRLITARRNPNMVILVVALLFGRPDVGLELVGAWTIVSLLFHMVRLAQAEMRSWRGGRIVSWLA